MLFPSVSIGLQYKNCRARSTPASKARRVIPSYATSGLCFYSTGYRTARRNLALKTASPPAASLAFRWGETVPDHTRIWAFRQKLAELGLDKKLFEEFNRQIEAQGLLVIKGTLIDAVIIKSRGQGAQSR